MVAAEVLELAQKFRVPVPDIRVGGYGAIVVQHDRAGTDRWAVTDGAVTGLGPIIASRRTPGGCTHAGGPG